jgi:manganese transport protein
MSAGARFGYLLVWVVVLGNAMAWLIQYLSAKLGVVTGKSLAETLGERITSTTGRRAYWLQAELVAMATDIAEIIGGAVALWLLFDIPLLAGGAITGAVSMLLLWIQSRRGAKPFEFVVIALLAVISVGFTVGVFLGPPDGGSVIAGLVPRFEGSDSVLLAASILGATVMPHAIYAHSALARDRFAPDPLPLPVAQSVPPTRSSSSVSDRNPDPAAPVAQSVLPDPGSSSSGDRSGRGIPRLLRATRWDVTIALAIAGSVNLAILLLGAANLPGVPGTDSLEGAHAALAAVLGGSVATVFAVGLLASGLASTAVGAYAGSEIMHGLLRVRVPVLARRVVTLIPALAVLGAGFDPTQALILSQVVLSFGIPFTLVPLVWLTAREGVLGSYRNRWWTTMLGAIFAAFLIALNALLLWLTVAG